MTEYIECDKCNGDGIVKDPDISWNYCKTCRGTGRLNWLENIFGKNGVDTNDDINLRTYNHNRYFNFKKRVDDCE